MPLTVEELDRIAALTLAHYNERAEDFWEGTRDHDVSQNIAALLRHMGGTPPFTILDVGCGPGRDLKTFTELGHLAIGLEGAQRLAAMARVYSRCEVWEQNLLALHLPAERFDGLFANAVLFHVPSEELPQVLRTLHAALKPGGVLFSSNPRGEGQEGWHGGRYCAFHGLPTWRGHMAAVGFAELEHSTGQWGCRRNSSRGWRVSGGSEPPAAARARCECECRHRLRSRLSADQRVERPPDGTWSDEGHECQSGDRAGNVRIVIHASDAGPAREHAERQVAERRVRSARPSSTR